MLEKLSPTRKLFPYLLPLSHNIQRKQICSEHVIRNFSTFFCSSSLWLSVVSIMYAHNKEEKAMNGNEITAHDKQQVEKSYRYDIIKM